MNSNNNNRDRASRPKVVKVSPEVASAAAALPADLFADIVGDTRRAKEEAKVKRESRKSAPFIKLTADELSNLRSVGWKVPRVGDTHTVEFKVIKSHYTTDLSEFYKRIAGALKANGNIRLSEVARGYSLVIKAQGLKPQARTVILQQVANRLQRNVAITENIVSI